MGMKYVRCRYCDSSFEQAKDSDPNKVFRPKKLKKQKNVVHDKVMFKCPACGYNTISFLFPE